MRDFISGSGGSVTFTMVDSSYVPFSLVTFDVALWRLDDSDMPADVSHVGPAGTRYASKGQYNLAWSFALPVDFLNLPEVSLIRSGVCTNCWLKTGDRDYWHKISLTKIDSVANVDDSTNDVIRSVITGSGGDILYYSPIQPSIPAPLPPPAVPYIGDSLDVPGTL